jgi:redox-sensitive bicupin YhaK (pirin superfamily)
MINIRKMLDRGHADHGWLKTYHSFSFGNYYDPGHIRFKSLRVMNEDWIAPGKGFPLHPHDNMEILTYVLDGEIEHRDSMGNKGVLKAGEFQLMHAGTGILHSEANPSDDELHLYQIWIMPDKRGHEPGYQQKAAFNGEATNRLALIASKVPKEGAMLIHQDVQIFLARLDAGSKIDYTIPSGRSVWIQATRDEVVVNGNTLEAGDGAAITAESELSVAGGAKGGELLLFDLK